MPRLSPSVTGDDSTEDCADALGIGAIIIGSVGWMPAFGDGAESIVSTLRIALALRAKLKKTGHSPVLNISFITKYAGYSYGTGGQGLSFRICVRWLSNSYW